MGKHYIPQQYLRGFACPTEPNKIWMYDKQTRAWSKPAIKRAAQQRDYFSPEVEHELTQRFEKPGNRAMEKLRADERLSSRDQEDLLRYVACMMMRVPRKRRLGHGLFPKVLRDTVGQIRRELGEIGKGRDPGELTRLYSDLDRIEEEYLREIPSEFSQQIKRPWPGPRLIAVLGRMSWRHFVIRGDIYFITSDFPVSYDPSTGIAWPDSQIIFPVSSRSVMIGEWGGVQGDVVTIETGRHFIAEINARIAQIADRFIFAPRWEGVVETSAKGSH